MMPERISHYRIIEEIGKGGMGVVYKGVDERLDRVVALKVLAPQYAEDPGARKRFIREARVASSLQHQHICTIHEIDETAGGQLFISMDYYEGETLQQILLRGLPPLETILDYAIQIAEGLAAAHTRNIIHRDIKPGNIMITPEGKVRILDFGLAKLTGKYDSTHTGKVLGSVSYISPEQAQGTGVDHLTDIWSLGVVLYEMSTGVLPFAHEYDAAVIYSILDKSPVPPTEINEEVPEALEILIYKCLRKNKKERIQSAEEALRELATILESMANAGNEVTRKKQVRKREAERRMVTLLVAEISNYQELVSRMDEEEADRIFQHCSDLIDSTAGKYGGILTGRSDQNLTFLFGLARTGENAPVQAVNAAIDISGRMKHLNETDRPDPPVIMKLGINTGTAIVKISSVHEGTDKYTVTGDTPALAHQIKSLSTEGRILVGPVTYRHTNRLFEYSPSKPMAPSGGRDPFPVYELRSNGIRDIRKTIPLDGLVRTEMVGREEELDLLHFYLLKLIWGEGFIVNVIGEAGVGKSRLIAEFLRMDEIRRVTVLEGHALASGENLSFYPVIGLIKSMAGIGESEDEKGARHKLEASIRHFCSGEAGEVFPFIARLMGMELTGDHAERLKGLEGEGLEKLILKNLRTLVTMASEKKPLVILLEDLHWADQSSLRLLKSLLRLAGSHPVLFINVFRPDYRETGEMMRTAVRDRFEKFHTEINLGTLTEQESELLINKLLNTRSVQGRASAIIYERAEGNPLYLEELVRSMIDEGSISVHEGTVSVSKDTGSLAVPGTLHEVLIARIDRLDEDSRSLVRTASVIGRHFFRKVLCEVVNETDIDRILDHLKQIQLIRETRRMQEVEYLFRHVLIQQAAYDTILPKQRKELHLKVARAIETVFSDRIHDFFGILAYHYSLGEDPDHSEKYLIHAGEQALRSSASFEALHYFREALHIYLERHGDLADPRKTAMLLKNVGIAHFNSGHFIEIDQYMEKALAFYGVRIPRNPLLLYPGVMYGLIVFLFRIWFPSTMGRQIPSEKDREINELILKKCEALTITESMRYVTEMLLAAPRLTKFHSESLEALVALGNVFSFGGISFTIAQKILDDIRDRLHEHDKKNLIASEDLRAVHHLLSGNWKNETYDPDMAEIGIQAGDLYNTNTYLAMQAHMYLERGDRTAGKILEKLAEIAEMFDYDYGRLAKYSHGSLCLYKFREFDQAIALADEGIAWMNRTLGNKPGTLMIYSMKIKSLIMLGRLDEAEEALKMAHDFSRQEKLVPYFHSFFLTASLLFGIRKLEETLSAGDKTYASLCVKRMRKSAKKAVKISKKAAYERVECYRLTGIYFWLLGKQARALRWWSKALREAERLGAKIERALTLEEVSGRLSETGSRYRTLKGESAASLNASADRLFKEMEIQRL